MAHLYYQFYLIDVRRNMVVCNEAYKIFQCNINLGMRYVRFYYYIMILLIVQEIGMIHHAVPYHNTRPLEIAIWHYLFKVNSFKSESVDSNIYSWQ